MRTLLTAAAAVVIAGQWLFIKAQNAAGIQLTEELVKERELSDAQADQIRALLHAWRVISDRHLRDLQRLATQIARPDVDQEIASARTELENVDEIIQHWSE